MKTAKTIKPAITKPVTKAAEIQPDYPLSEKDEVKQAERRLKESQQKNG